MTLITKSRVATALAGIALMSLSPFSLGATASGNLIDLEVDNGTASNNSSIYISQQGVENVIGNDGRFATFSPTGGTITDSTNLSIKKIEFSLSLQGATFSSTATIGDGTLNSNTTGSDVTFSAITDIAATTATTGSDTLASASTRALLNGLNQDVQLEQIGDGNFLSLNQVGDSIDLSYSATGDFNVTELDVGQKATPSGSLSLAINFVGDSNTFDFNLGAASNSVVDGTTLEFQVTGSNNFGFVDITGDSNTNYIDLIGSGNAFALEQSGSSNLVDALMNIDDSEIKIEQTSNSNTVTLELSGDNQALYIFQGAAPGP